MALQITEKGVVIERLNEIQDRLAKRFRDIYGQDIIIDPDTPDGQMIGIFSQSLADINEIIAFIVQMLDPYQATGAWLEQRALYSGITRRTGSYSYINEVAITDSPGRTVPEDTVLVDRNNVRWVTENDLVLDSNGSGRVKLRSEERGVFELSENESLTFEVLLSATMKATTLIAATPGSMEESDAKLLRRFMLSHAINSEDSKEGIKAALLNIPEVKKAEVLENDENETDKETGLPPHSMNAIVVGGEPEDIMLALMKKKGGAAFYGQVEDVIRYKGADRRVRWDYGTPVPVTVSLQYERLKPLTDLGTEIITETLKATDFDLHENVYAQKLVCGINSDANFNLIDIKVNGGSKVDIDWREYAEITDVEITIV